MSTSPETFVRESIQNPASIPNNVGPQLEKFVRDNPATALLAAVGIGCAVGILSRTMLHSPPPPPRTRAQQILEDIHSRLSELVEPTYKQASHLAEDGATAVRKGIDTINESHVARRLRNLFS